MVTLVIDTSSDAVCLSVGTSLKDSTNIVLSEKSRHGENLFIAIADALASQDIDIKMIEAIGVGIGPGSFTGLRIGIISAHTLAHALNIPLVYFSSLELFALSEIVRNSISGEVSVYRDARRKENYCATFSIDDFSIRRVQVDGVEIASLLNRIETEHLEPYSDSIIENNSSDLIPSSAIELVQKAVEKNITANVFGAQAIYIRKSDAELSWNVKK